MTAMAQSEAMDHQTHASSRQDRKFFCRVCDLNFINHAALIQHAQTIHSARPLTEVIEVDNPHLESLEVEEVACNNGQDVAASEVVGNVDISEVYLCSDCGEVFLSEETMEEHCVNDHSTLAEQKRIFECSNCRKRYESEELFDEHDCDDPQPELDVTTSADNTHQNIVEISDGPDLMCHTCSIMFASKYALSRHIDIVHSQAQQRKNKFTAPKRRVDGRHECGRCKATFSDIKDLKNHAVTVHKMKWTSVRERTPQNCPVCKKTFSSTGNMNKHLKVVHRQTPTPIDIQSHVKRARNSQEINIVVECVTSTDGDGGVSDVTVTKDVVIDESNVEAVETKRNVDGRKKRGRRLRSSKDEVQCTEAVEEQKVLNVGDVAESKIDVLEMKVEVEASLPDADSAGSGNDTSSMNEDNEASEAESDRPVETVVISSNPAQVPEQVSEIEFATSDDQVVTVDERTDLGGYVLQLDESMYAAMELGELHMIIADGQEKNTNKENLQESVVDDVEQLEKETQVTSRRKSGSKDDWYWYCHPCSIQFIVKDSLITHHRQLHLPDDCEPDTGSNQQCDVCLKIFSTKGNRDKHLHTVHRIQPGKSTDPASRHTSVAESPRMECDYCEKSFRQRGNLIKHVRKEHGEHVNGLPTSKLNIDATPDDKTCEICGKTFANLLKKEMHVYNHNRSKKIHKCVECDKTFNRIDYLREHYDKKHGLPKFKCSFCDKRFVRRAYLIVHERVHTNERPYRCDLCGKGFKQWGGLYQHKRFHDPKPPATHFCKHCHKGYSYKADLDRHLIIHSDRRHECSYCSRPFPTASQLTVHIRTHTGQRPYKCQLCSMCFMTMGGLKRHQQIHDRRDAGSFICGICGASYRRQSSMDEHIRVFHQSEEQCIEETVVDIGGENAHGEEVIEFVVQEDGTVQLTQGDLQALARGCDNNWVETSDLEKELVEGIFASQAVETALPVIAVATSQENEVSS